MSRLTLTTEGERHIIVTRRFDAPPSLLWRAHTEAALLQQWCVGPDGWTMPECISEAVPGGRIFFRWADASGHGFHLTGHSVEVTPHHRIVHVERMHLPDPTPDNHVVTLFQPDAGGTILRMTMTLPEEGVRAAMLATGMADGMEASYQRLERWAGHAADA